jgi:preprotein translocase subunit SecA
MYTRLAGMTGTAKTEAEEFSKIYGLQVITIPTNRPVARRDLPDSVYKTETGKLKAIAERIKSVHETGQPILVGTVTIEKSELIGQMLLRSGVPAKILNAKHHEREAEIIARAGERGAVTIATNMAGRGTDIKLATGVAELGGLYVLGTERHESRRIDNQLRGRSGRQGDPGTSQFFVSMEDSLMRLFGGDKMKRIMEFLRVPDDMPIENKSISNNIESAQKKVEAHNFDIRKHVVQYDDVMNRHREIIYGRRRQILEHTEIKSAILSLLGEEAAELVRATAITPDAADWDYEQLLQSVQHLCPALGTLTLSELQTHTKSAALKNFLTEKLEAAYLAKEATLENPAALRHTERQIYLATLDRLWMEHLENMRYLREKVALRGYGQRDPLLEYKGEAYQLFDTLMQNIRTNTIQTLFRTEIGIAPSVTTPTRTQIITNDAEITDILTGDRELVGAPTIPKTDPTSSLQFASLSELPKANPEVATLGSTGPTVIKLNSEQKNQGNLETGRNELCPCGSKKKFKKCCG